MNQKQLKRLLELSNIKGTSMKESTNRNMGAIELIKKAADGKTYAIVRENRNYYIKNTDTKDTLKESDFNYIGGVQNKSRNSFHSFEEATFKLNLLFNDINRNMNIRESVDMKTFDYVLNESGEYVNTEALDPRIKGAAASMREKPDQDKKETRKRFNLESEGCGDLDECGETDGEVLMDGEKEQLEEKRFVLKQPKKKEKPLEDKGGDFDFGSDTGGDKGGDEFDFGGGDTEGDTGGDKGEFDFGGDDTEGDTGGDEFDFGGDEGTDETDTEGGDEFDFGGDTEGGDEFDMGGDVETTEGDPIKDIQRTTGKLGQQLRDTEDLSSDMQKYVINSVLSALDLSRMDSNDKESVINKLESSSKAEGGDEIDFMDDEYQVEYQGGRTFEDDYERGGEPELEDDEEILLDDEGMGGYLGWEDDEEYEEIPMSQIDMSIKDKGYLNMDPSALSGVDYMEDDMEVEGPIVYMTDDMMEECGPGVDCGEEMDEGMTSWMDADDTGGMGSDSNKSSGLGWEHGGGGVSENTSYMGDEYSEEDIDRMLGNIDTYDMNNPAPVKPKEKEQAPTRPSKSPFSPPERIRPGEEPRPKANQPSPTKEPAPTTAPPTTRPETPTRPSRTPFSPPERIRPGEEPRPKADYDDDVTFE